MARSLAPATHAAYEREFLRQQAKCFDARERRPIEIAPNDKEGRIKNRREPGAFALPMASW